MGYEDQRYEGDVPEIDFVGLNAAFKFALYWSVGLLVVLVIVSRLGKRESSGIHDALN